MQPQSALEPTEARALAHEAYLYAFAMLENYDTCYKQAVDDEAPEYLGGFNVFRHYAQCFTPANRDIVTPNNDTPYSWAWLDLRAEPIVVSVPAVPEGRYYVLQLVDLFTYNFAYIGVRATGFHAGDYLVVGPAWRDLVPGAIKQSFRSETGIVCILGRTQLNGPDDLENVRKIQAGFKLKPLSAYLGKPAAAHPAALKFPRYDKARARTHDFITYLNFLLRFAQPPYPSEVSLRKQFTQIGISPGVEFDAAKVDPAVLLAIDAGVKDAQAELKAKIDVTHSSNGLFGSRDFLGQDYLTRAVAAAMGLYGNSLEEAWYGGAVGDGRKLCTLTFPAGQLPPAKFFWSITLYTLPDRFLYDNPLKRYSIGDRSAGLQYGADGSLTLFLGYESPGKDKESNWLPAPAEPYSFVARIYGPGAAAIKGQWKLPQLEPVK